jgi:hypothetical protein
MVKGLGPVPIAQPPGIRATGDVGGFTWAIAADEAGCTPYSDDLKHLHELFTTDYSRQVYLRRVKDFMLAAQDGLLEYGDDKDVFGPMAAGRDVLEIRLPDWEFSVGRMHVRLYYSEPSALPTRLVLLRLKAKWPGEIGLAEQTDTIKEASALLQQFRDSGYPGC